MNVGELIQELSRYNPDSNVTVLITDECDDITTDLWAVERVVRPDGIQIELIGC